MNPDCAACEHVLNIPTVDFVTVKVCGHPKSGGRFTAWQAREDVLRCGPGGAWYLDRAAMDRACK